MRFVQGEGEGSEKKATEESDQAVCKPKRIHLRRSGRVLRKLLTECILMVLITFKLFISYLSLSFDFTNKFFYEKKTVKKLETPSPREEIFFVFVTLIITHD